MINLIPPDARRRVKQEYWIRVVSVWMMLIATALLMVALLRVPVYVLVKSQLEAFSDTYEQATSDDLEFKASEDAIKDANHVGSLLAVTEGSLRFSEVLAAIDSLAGSEIVITSYALTRTDGQVSGITVVGQADTRFALAAFKDALEASDYFESAALPLSNLAKDRDIPFNIVITPTKVTAS